VSIASLPPDLEQFVLDQLAAGKYQSSSDVLCDAVRLLRDRELRRAELQREIDRGIGQLDSGEYVELSSDAELQAFFDEAAVRGQQRTSTKRGEP
jgi:putative addiction module CopG family antidote